MKPVSDTPSQPTTTMTIPATTATTARARSHCTRHQLTNSMSDLSDESRGGDGGDQQDRDQKDEQRIELDLGQGLGGDGGCDELDGAQCGLGGRNSGGGGH